MISKTGAVRALKEAHKKGYEILPGGETITLCTAKWMAVAMVRQLPVEVSQILVEHVGYLPTTAELVRKRSSNQSVMRDVYLYREDTVRELENQATRMYKIPVIFKEQWQLFRSDSGVYAFHMDLLAMISEDIFADTFVTEQGIGVWKYGDEAVFIAPGHFDLSDRDKLQRIALLYEQPRTTPECEPENMSLFDDLEGDEDE